MVDRAERGYQIHENFLAFEILLMKFEASNLFNYNVILVGIR